MIIWLASYPRSGNTFYRMLLHNTFGIRTYSVYRNPNGRGPWSDAVGHEELFAPLAELAADRQVHLVKTHDLPSDAGPAVYLVRDGRDALVSHARYIRTFDQQTAAEPFEQTLRRLITSGAPFGGWSKNVQGWARRLGTGQTLFVKYEDLCREPAAWAQRMVDAFALDVKPVGGQELPSFAELHAKWPQFFRKGQSGGWREEMDEETHQLFWDHHAQAMQLFGYTDDQLEPSGALTRAFKFVAGRMFRKSA